MAKKEPLVSIIITNYNYAQYVGEAIQSVLNQTYGNIELIVVDDGSTDESRDVISGFAANNKNVHLISQKNEGIVSARNAGIKSFNGDFILFLDGDDLLPRDYVEILKKRMTKEKIDVAYTDYQRFEDDDEVSNFPEFNLETLKRRNYIHISALVRRKVLKGHQFDKNLAHLSHEDWDFFLGLALDGAIIKKIAGTRLLYRAHASSRSLRVKKSISEYREQSLKLVKSFLYIVDKYKAMYPGKMDVYDDSEIVEWCRLSFERLEAVNELKRAAREAEKQRKKEIAEAEEIIQAKDRQIDLIVKSRSYRMGRMFAKMKSAVLSKIIKDNRQ